MIKRDDYNSYEEFAKALYSENYFNMADPTRANYVAGFGGTWYDEVVAWLNNALFFEEKTILDAGCAVGGYMQGVAKLTGFPNEIYGVDVSAYAIEAAKNLFEKGAFPDNFKIASLDDLPYSNGVFDVVYSAEVIEHLDPSKSEAFLAEIKRVLVPGGLFFMQGQIATTKEEIPSMLNVDQDEGHINIRTAQFWVKAAKKAGLSRSKRLELLLKNSAADFIKHYNWKFFIFTAN